MNGILIQILIQGETVKRHDLKKWQKLEIKEKLIYLNKNEMYNNGNY